MGIINFDEHPIGSRYIISLNELLISNDPKSISETADLLNNNGYLGRHEILLHEKDGTLNKNRYDSNISRIKISVRLLDSNIDYIWPYNTYYDWETRRFGKRRKPAVIRNDFRLSKCMYFFVTTGCMITGNLDKVAELGSLMMGWADKSEYKKMIIFLIQADLFHKGEFKLKSHIDVYEYYNNMFDYHYFVM
jgi:hypothetical protein